MSLSRAEMIELADLVVERIDQQRSDRLLTAAELAECLCVERAWVYENAGRLGAIKLTTGSRSRLRFHWSAVLERLQAPEVAPTARTSRGSPPAAGAPADLLPIRRAA